MPLTGSGYILRGDKFVHRKRLQKFRQIMAGPMRRQPGIEFAGRWGYKLLSSATGRLTSFTLPKHLYFTLNPLTGLNKSTPMSTKKDQPLRIGLSTF
ncbi:MAG: hypothetical protein ACMVP2_26550 [Imperialibacter sp.]|uniref:hypothetical protein n=1 Tax=Imperialibacter sp. TaxID=2038411 RepID=UPI003A861340